MQSEVSKVVERVRKRLKDASAVVLLYETAQEVERLSSGLLSLDLALGGGWPKGRISQIYGTYGSGKTSLGLRAVAEAQKAGMVCAYIDVEHAVNPQWASVIGADLNNVIFSQPSSGDEAFEIVKVLIEEGAKLVVIDSVAALVTRDELEGAITDVGGLAPQARLMSQSLRRLTGVVANSGAILLFINQVRSRISLFGGGGMARPGGNALDFYCSVIVRTKVEERKDSYIRVEAFVEKNKTAPPFKKALFTIGFESGFDPFEDMADTAIVVGAVQKRGSFYYWGEQRFRGRGELVEALRSDPALFDSVKEASLNAAGYPESEPIEEG